MFFENKLAIAGVVIVVFMFAFCFLGPLFYHTDQVHTNLNQVTLPPGAGHPLGTDSVGYDELGRLMVGGQTSLTVGLSAAIIATVIGSLWGAISGYAGGLVDSLMMRTVDVLLSIPTLFLLLFMATIFQPTRLVLIIIIAAVSWLVTSRLIRGETLSLKVREYVQAAKVMGASGRYSMFRHVLPNAVGTIAVNVTFQVADAILLLAAMSYLGPRRPGAVHRLGRHALGRGELQLLRLLVADLSARPGHRGDRRGVQLHRRRPPRLAARPPPADQVKGGPPMLLEISDLHTVVTGAAAPGARRQRGVPPPGPGRGARHRRRVRLGQDDDAMSILRLLPRGGAITGGSIRFDGTDLVSLPEREIRKVRGDGIGVVFQDPLSSLNPTMSIGDQIAENVLLHRQVSRAEALDRAVEVLSLVGLPQPKERIREFPHQFSGGMRQRAMIAIALACDPKLLIADEPTTALDVTIQKQILALIDGLRERLGMAVILVTHDLGVIAGHADRVAVMYAGKIAETASTDQVFAHARHPYTVALFDALPERVTQAGERLRTIPGMPPDLSAPLAGCAFAPRCANAQDTCSGQRPAAVRGQRARLRLLLPGRRPAPVRRTQPGPRSRPGH